MGQGYIFRNGGRKGFAEALASKYDFVEASSYSIKREGTRLMAICPAGNAFAVIGRIGNFGFFLSELNKEIKVGSSNSRDYFVECVVETNTNNEEWVYLYARMQSDASASVTCDAQFTKAHSF